jgi:hypothetical protein
MRTHHENHPRKIRRAEALKREAAVHISNVMVIDPTTDEPSRIGRKRIEEEGGGRWVRYAKQVAKSLINNPEEWLKQDYTHYKEEIVPKLTEEFKYENVMAYPNSRRLLSMLELAMPLMMPRIARPWSKISP